MVNTEQLLRVCPSRIDGAPVLFAHKVDVARCQDRQRQRYHKCFTCAFNNSYVAQNGLPDIAPADEPSASHKQAVKVG